MYKVFSRLPYEYPVFKMCWEEPYISLLIWIASLLQHNFPFLLKYCTQKYGTWDVYVYFMYPTHLYW